MEIRYVSLPALLEMQKICAVYLGAIEDAIAEHATGTPIPDAVRLDAGDVTAFLYAAGTIYGGGEPLHVSGGSYENPVDVRVIVPVMEVQP